ncbi:MAG: ImmA/IrrE family metallo-endopeptidase [Planctomycetaceae bacterium]|nr:ImmA/IrrE family metallo-endopeptidase [Planctomycetaceae bacterium]
MTTFNATYLEIEPRELVTYLLRESGQFERESVDTANLLELLGLDYVSFNFDLELPQEAKQTVGDARPRALISFGDRIIATDSELDENRMRFSILHEVGHFVLPHHEHSLYVCDDIGLSPSSRLVFEKEASQFAADLLFLGDRFALEANSRAINAPTVKELATKYCASFEATARRIVEKSFRPCMLVVFKKEPRQSGDELAQPPTWSVRYCIASATFKSQYFEELSGTAPPEVATAVTRPGCDIANSHKIEVAVRSTSDQKELQFTAEFFSNTYNIFCLLTPK